MATLVRLVGTDKNAGRHWDKLQSKFACAAYVLDPEFHGDAPWRGEECRAALDETTQKLFYPLEGGAPEGKLCEVEAGYQRYFTKTGIFSKNHI